MPLLRSTLLLLVALCTTVACDDDAQQNPAEDTAVDTNAEDSSDGASGDGIDDVDTTPEPLSGVWQDRPMTEKPDGVSADGADVSVTNASLACQAFDLNGETLGTIDHSFSNGGGVSCGCPTPSEECKAVSAGLQPPELASE